MSKKDVLVVWQKTHGQLDDYWKYRFLERQELDEITLYPRHAIEDSLTASPKLAIVLDVLRRRWVKSEAKMASERPKNPRVTRANTQSVREKTEVSTRRRDESTADLAEEGKILPLPDDPKRSRRRGSPGYRTGVEAELRSIAQRHKWF
jgi:hypothetical protein